MRMNAIGSTVILFLAGFSVAAAALVSDAGMWKLRKEESAASMNRSGDRIEVKFPACKTWPAVYLEQGAFGVREFKGFQYFVFDAENLLDKPTSLRLEFRLSSPGGLEYRRDAITLRPGKHSYKIKLTGEFQQFPIASVYFYVSQPDYDSHFALSDLRLERRERKAPIPPVTVGDRAQLMLERFDSPDALKRWTLRIQDSGATARVQDITRIDGRPALEVSFPTCKVWPAIHTSGDNLPAAEHFDNYDFLAADIVNLNSYRDEVKLELRIRDRNGVASTWRHQFEIRPGLNRCRLPMTYDLQAAQLDEIYLFAHKPGRNKNFVIANLRFESWPLADKQNQLRDMIRRLSLDSANPALDKEVENARNLTPSNDFKVLFAQLDQLRDLTARVESFNRQQTPALFRAAARNGMAWGWANGSDRVYRDEQRFPGSIGGAGKLALARGESEGIQLCLFPLTDRKDVSVSVGALTSDSGAVLPASAMEVAPVGFVNIRRMRYYADRIGWTPDPILDYLKRFELNQEKLQPVWIDVKAAANQQPGLYRGTVTVADGAGKLLEVPLEVVVRKFELPYKNSFPVATASRFDDNYYDAMYGDGKPETVKAFRSYLKGETEFDALSPAGKHMVEVMHRFEAMISAHRIPNDHIYRPSPIKIEDLKRYLADRNSLVCLFAVEKHNTPEQLVEWMDRLAPVIVENNWQNNVYVYGFDEINPELFGKAVATFRPLKKKYPWLKVMTTAFDYSLGLDTGMNEVIDIWVPQIRQYFANHQEVATVRGMGKEVWYYVCCYPSPPVANWLLESQPTSTRLLLGFMPYKFKSQGFLEWALLRWKANRTFTENGKTVTRELIWDKKLTDGPMTSHDGKGFYEFNGDGFLFYPGENGPVPTVRARLVRDGLEDYEYLKLLEQRIAAAKQGSLTAPAGWLERAERELAIEDSLVKAEHVYTHDGRELIAKRDRIAVLLDEVTR